MYKIVKFTIRGCEIHTEAKLLEDMGSPSILIKHCKHIQVKCNRPKDIPSMNSIPDLYRGHTPNSHLKQSNKFPIRINYTQHKNKTHNYSKNHNFNKVI